MSLRFWLFSLLAATSALAAPSSGSLQPSGNKYSGWAKKWYEPCLERVAAMNGECDLIFIGDSITMGWTFSSGKHAAPGQTVWDEYYAKRQALNFGIGGDTTGNILWRLDEQAVQGFQPKAVVIMIGTNNYQKAGDCTPEEIATGVKQVLDKARTLYPETKVVLMSITHGRRRNAEDADAILMAANEIIQGYADGESVVWVDLADKMTPEGEGWKETGGDNLHLNQDGYRLWAESIEPVLAPILPR